MFTRCGNLRKILFYLVPVIHVGCRQGSKADDGVHRSTDVVGHIVEEGSLCSVCTFRPHQCLLQFLMTLLQLLIELQRPVGCLPCPRLGRLRFFQETKNQQQDPGKCHEQHDRHYQQIFFYKIKQRDFFQCILIHRQRSGEHGRRHCPQGLIQNGEQHRIISSDRKRRIIRLCQIDAVQLAVFDIVFQLSKTGDQAVCLSVPHRLFHIRKGVTLDRFPARILIGNVPFQQKISFFDRNTVLRIFVKIALGRDRRHIVRPDRIGQNKPILFSCIRNLAEMKNHIDLAVFQRLHLFLLRVKSHERKVERLVVQAVFCKLNVVCKNPDHFTTFGLTAADTGIPIQPADPDRTMLRHPVLLLPGEHRRCLCQKIPLIKLICIKRIVILQLTHRIIKCFFQIRAAFIDDKIDIRTTDQADRGHTELYQLRRLCRNKAVYLMAFQLLHRILQANDRYVL